MKRRDFIRSLLPLVAPEILVAQPSKVYSFLRENPLAKSVMLPNVRSRVHTAYFDTLIRTAGLVGEINEIASGYVIWPDVRADP